jgi:hypothetical protein
VMTIRGGETLPHHASGLRFHDADHVFRIRPVFPLDIQVIAVFT